MLNLVKLSFLDTLYICILLGKVRTPFEWADEGNAKCCMGDGRVMGDCYEYYDWLKIPEKQIYYLYDTIGH